MGNEGHTAGSGHGLGSEADSGSGSGSGAGHSSGHGPAPSSGLGSGPGAAAVLAAIRARLGEVGADWREVLHAPTRTSAESAVARGEPLEIGAKALVLKLDERFVLLVLSAARQLDSGALRRALGAKKSRFATAQELLDLTGLVPGSVPPFGPPVLDLPLFADRSLAGLERVAFNAGSLTHSMVLARPDWQRAAEPLVWIDASV